GTGSGILTQGLAKTVLHSIHSFEIDPPTFEVALAKLAAFPQVTLHNADFLEATIPFSEPYIVVANIPYYITSPIIAKCLTDPLLQGLYLMVQKEIANRIIAQPGESDYSSFSIFCQTRAKARKLFAVSRNCFFPKPNVDSAFIEILPRGDLLSQIRNLPLYEQIVHSAFWGKRKTLLNCLSKSPYVRFNKDELLNIFHELNISETLRGEALSIDSYILMSNLIGTRLVKLNRPVPSHHCK
ncbi:MAG: 16S rRNA (adenine(1518)-N(6)/adenine(1519)-N(6))-dimethyltransferase RsmA, partial [Candidatus Margulisiibacteriota bacterium]